MSMMPLDLPEFLPESPLPEHPPAPPLSPMSFGEILGETWRIVSQNPWLWIKLALLAIAPLFLLLGCFLAYLMTDPMFSQSAADGYAENQFTPILCLIFPAILAVSIFWGVTFQGGGIHLAGKIYRGEYTNMLESVGYVWRERFWTLVGVFLNIFAILVGIVIMILIGLRSSDICMVGAIPIALFMAYAAYPLQLLMPVIILERESLGTLLNRAWHLGKGHLWTIVGGMFVLGLIQSGYELFANMFNRVFEDAALLLLIFTLFNIFISLLIQVANFAFMTVTYYDARVRLEQPATEDELMTGTPPDIFTGEPFMTGRDWGNMFGLIILGVLAAAAIFIVSMMVAAIFS